MELRQLNMFRTVASTLNFSRAAESMGYVPSNVTMQIKALEDELGVRLFDRLGKQLVLTGAGKRFLIHIESALDKLDEARNAVHDDEHLSGTLTISANEVLCAYRLPVVFHLFRSKHPGVRLIFRSVPNQQLKHTLLRGPQMWSLCWMNPFALQVWQWNRWWKRHSVLRCPGSPTCAAYSIKA